MIINVLGHGINSTLRMVITWKFPLSLASWLQVIAFFFFFAEMMSLQWVKLRFLAVGVALHRDCSKNLSSSFQGYKLSLSSAEGILHNTQLIEAWSLHSYQRNSAPSLIFHLTSWMRGGWSLAFAVWWFWLIGFKLSSEGLSRKHQLHESP